LLQSKAQLGIADGQELEPNPDPNGAASAEVRLRQEVAGNEYGQVAR
jgi:hypothetical protein